jgi:dienelactone hydrolase
MKAALLRWACLLAAAMLAPMAHAEEIVHFDSLDRDEGTAVSLKAYWHPVAAAKAPAVVMLHGCGGMYGRGGLPSERTVAYARLFNEQGFHVLVVDSLTPRGEREICTQRTGTRRITMTQRRRDALASLQWLAARPEVDATRLGLVGWSNGGSTVLAATNRQHREVAAAEIAPAFAVAYYPGCQTDLARGYAPTAPLLMMVGEADDWTPAAPCLQLAEQSAEPRPQIERYPGAYHGFDSDAPLRLRRDVPNGTHPGQGVHVGGNPQAHAASRERLKRFLQAFTTPAAAR